MKEIKQRIKYFENNKLEKQLSAIEAQKEDSNKCFQAIRELNKRKPKKPLIVQGEDNMLAGSEKEQADIITTHFRKMFTVENKEKHIETPPTKMYIPFTPDEVTKAAKSMKNNKSAGVDQLNAEYVKYGPPEIKEGIADLLNNMAQTGTYPEEIKTGILIPLPKPGKKQGPPSNLRPIILLSVLRKILAICLIKRCWNRLSSKIPIDQAAYQAGRSTTEQVFAVKTLAEKAISTSNYEIYILMLDMSKAFDTVNRNKLMSDLQQVLNPDELHLLSILIYDVNLKVKIGTNFGEVINTEVGIAQGDCLSAVLFIYYLANSLNITAQEIEHSYSKTPEENILPTEHQDHNYYKPRQNFFEIEPKYADDITWATTAKHRIEHVKQSVPEKLSKRHLIINATKTEEYKISKNSDEKWKSCKLLGTLLDTEKDITRRKNSHHKCLKHSARHLQQQ